MAWFELLKLSVCVIQKQGLDQSLTHAYTMARCLHPVAKSGDGEKR